MPIPSIISLAISLITTEFSFILTNFLKSEKFEHLFCHKLKKQKLIKSVYPKTRKIFEYIFRRNIFMLHLQNFMPYNPKYLCVMKNHKSKAPNVATNKACSIDPIQWG